MGIQRIIRIRRSIVLIPVVFCLAVIFAISFLPACSSKKEQSVKKPVVPVTVGAVIKKTVPVHIRAIGNVEAYSTVSIKARVGGDLTHVYFREGQNVNKGDMLFTIDPQLYKTVFESAKANLVRDTALAKKANEDLRRYTELLRDELVSRSQYEQIFANAEALKATVEADKAAVENARLQVEYCTIYAPIAGRTGSLLVNQGNLVKANDDKPMVIINQLQPVYVNFSLPEQYLPEIKKYMSAGRLRVQAYIGNEGEKSEDGVLTFVDNTVDISTGTIKLKATFTNKEKRLWPGQFANSVITLTTKPDSIVIPSQAVQTGQKGQYVFVVKDDMTVESRPVNVVMTLNDESVIERGLKPGEKVVTDGQLRLIPGVKVEIKNPSEGSK
ncbi:MAG: efflux RND transporter periplasmic adaptor subunit [Nitrospirae bacterium]|nr:efflux RND transporter periplasmic adaptor subunit [Nitrospirota bacterium]